MKKNILVIDAGPSAAYLSQALAQLGFHSIALFTAPMESRDIYFQVDKNVFDEQIFLSHADAATLINTARQYNPSYIINGSDDAVSITDLLNTALLPKLANDPKTSETRCNKFNMQEALKAHGLPYIQQIKVNKEALTTLDLNSLRFPCFCKPAHGICTVGAFKANDANEFQYEMQKYQNTIHDYLIQEFVAAEEYVVDSFSYQGQHYISSIQKYQKRMIDHTPTYGYCEVVHDEIIWDACSLFVKECLRATGLNNGFCHTEIFRLEDGSFRLIEINPRISGIKGYYNQLAHLLGLHTQPEIMADCINANNPKESHFYDRKGFGRFLCLYNFSTHGLQDPSKALAQFSSVKFFNVLKPLGTMPNGDAKNLTATDLFVMLVHEDLSVLEQDTQAIFALEKAGELL